MALSVNNNAQALNTYRNLTTTQGMVSKSLEKLSSGYRINRAADDAAGLAISEGLRSQVSGLTQASRNAQDGISVVQTAEGALSEVHSILQRVRTLTVQGANDSNNADARKNIAAEVTELGKEVDRISKTTSFNGTNLLSASAATLTFQVGANGGADNQISVAANDISTLKATLDGVATALTSASGATASTTISSQLTGLDTAIGNISTKRASLGAVQNRFEHTINNLNTAAENLTSSESRIRDTDMASEMVSFSSKQILAQAGTAMLAQAKNLPQSILSLLQG